jgi:hypothetical protein
MDAWAQLVALMIFQQAPLVVPLALYLMND